MKTDILIKMEMDKNGDVNVDIAIKDMIEEPIHPKVIDAAKHIAQSLIDYNNNLKQRNGN